MIIGNDVSKYQGIIDWDVYKDNTNFVILKASEGNGFTDTAFLLYQAGARKVGLPLGFYHFARPDLNNSPEVEAEWFLKVCGQPREGEFLCLDYEVSWGGNVVGWCKGFLDKIAQLTGGVKCFVYLNQALIKQHDWSPVVNAGYALWVAAYTGSPTNNEFVTGNWPSAAMQQWTSTQTVPGIPARVDGNVFFGTVEQLKKYGYHSEPSPIPEPEPIPLPPIVPSYNCDKVQTELDQLKLNQEALIKEAVNSAISENDANWQIKLGSANEVIRILKENAIESLDWRTLFSIAFRKMWASKRI